MLAGFFALALSPAASAADIVDTAVAGKFNTLVAAVKAAGLVDTLKGPGPFTVFAPTDEAFAKLPAGALEDLLKPENKAKLQSILTYHVVPGKVMARDVSEAQLRQDRRGEQHRDQGNERWCDGEQCARDEDRYRGQQWRDSCHRQGDSAGIRTRMHLLTGATGYVGGRLLRRLEEDGLPVRCLCRDPEALRWRVAPGTELVRGRSASAGVSGFGVFRRGHRVLPGPLDE